ncbi:hypothetical protein CU098_012972 [Rhizopus stolonifer]|uniref:Uncharacterized protein n=1 Tax=Rhizopus stolonifer TaxID=4846 RepID=A0A367KNQ9_RHIST|nr:hypothetical protein CU098_012972 [Rhizopus stolonifer]
MPVDWVYASGSTWISFDAAAQVVIESLWQRGDSATWITCSNFPGPVYIDTHDMVVLYGSYSYTIARRSY